MPQGLIGAEDKYHTNGSFAIAQRWVHNLKVRDDRKGPRVIPK